MIAPDERHVETNEGTIAYTVTGTASVRATPIVLLPGFQSNAASWNERGYLDRLTDRLVLCIDPLGHGQSHKSHDAADYASDRMVAHVGAVLDQERIDQATIWGFSRGGIIAALCGELLPQRCAHVVMGAAPIGRAVELTHPALQRGEPPLAAGDWASYWQVFPVALPQALKDQFEQLNDPKACAAVIRALVRWDDEVPQHGLNDTGVPTFAYFGRGEIFAASLHDDLAQAGVDFFQGDWAGHAETMIDATGVVAAVLEWLHR